MSLNKQEIVNILYPMSREDLTKEYEKLKSNKLKMSSKAGSSFVNYFTAIERLDTKGNKNLSFYELYYGFDDYYNNQAWFRNALKNLFKDKYFNLNEQEKLKKLKSIHSFYFGSVSIFRPVISKLLCEKYKPRTVLDFTMGWGGRLVGCCSENIYKYIGIDLNVNLKPLYENMINALHEKTTTQIELHFVDALEVDYSKMNYDMILTSPPYYNIEIYNGTKRRSKDEWINEFYIPLFKRTYEHLDKGGYFCLNVNREIYESVCKTLFGECSEMINIGKPKRLSNFDNSEFVYIWKK